MSGGFNKGLGLGGTVFAFIIFMVFVVPTGTREEQVKVYSSIINLAKGAKILALSAVLHIKEEAENLLDTEFWNEVDEQTIKIYEEEE